MSSRLIFAIVFTSGILALSILAGNAGANPPPALLEIDGNEQTSGIGTNCWKVENEIYSVCSDYAGFITPAEPLLTRSPFTAHLRMPLPEPPEELGFSVTRVTDDDELKELANDVRMWRFNGSEGSWHKLPSKPEPDINLSLEPGLYVLNVFVRWEEKGDVSYGFLVKVYEPGSFVVGSTASNGTASIGEQKPAVSLISKGGLLDSYFEISIFDDGYIRKISGSGVGGRHPIYPDDILNLELENLRILDWQTEQNQLIAFLRETGFEQLKNLGGNVEGDEIILISLDGIHKEVVWGESGDTQNMDKFTKTWYTIDNIVENASRLEDNVKLNLKLSSNKTKFEKNESISFTLLLENSEDKKVYLSLPAINSASIILKIKDNKQSIIFPELHGIQLSNKTIALSPKENISFTLDIGTWKVKPTEGDYNEATYLKNTSGSYNITAIYSSYITNKQVLFGQIESNSIDFEIIAPPTHEVTTPGIKKPPDAEHPEKSIPAFELYGGVFSVLIILFLNKGKIMR